MSRNDAREAGASLSRRRFLQGSAAVAVSTTTAVLGRMAAYCGKTLTWDEALHCEKPLTTEAETWQSPAPVQPRPDGGYAIPVPGVTKVL